MKFKKFIALICVLSLSVGTAFAIQDVKKPKKGKTVQEKPLYTNEVHSVFSLQDCVEIAIKNNPIIRASLYEEAAYKSKIGQAWANYFPVINAGVDLTRSGTKYTHRKNLPASYRNTYNTMGYVPNVSADMLLFDFGKTKSMADIAKRTYEAKQADTKENINSIIYDIKSTYFNILFAQAQVKVYEDTVRDYQLQLDQAQGFYKFGIKPKIDVVTAEYNLGRAQLQLVKAKNVLKVARVQLAKVMGVPGYTNYELSGELSLNKYNLNIEDAIKTAMEVRPELVAAEKMAKAAKVTLRAARRVFTPDLNVFGSYGNGLGNNYDMRSTQFGVSLDYAGLNLLQAKKQLDEAKAEYQKSEAEYDVVRDLVYLNVESSYIELETAGEAIIIAKLALDQAKEQYKQVTGRYKAGVGDAIELKDGENTYLNARLDLYNAILNYNVTAANLEREIGVPIKASDELILDIKSEDI